MPALAEIAHAAPDVQFLEEVGIDIRDQGGLRIGGGFGDDREIGEGEIGRGKNRTLGVLNIHIDHPGEVPHTPGDGNITFVFNGAGLAAIAHPVIARGRVRAEGHKKQADPAICEETPQLRELDIIANKHGYLPAVGIEDLQFVSPDHAPIPDLAGSDVQLELMIPGAITAAQIDDVVEIPLFIIGHGAGDDINVILDRLLDEKVADSNSESSQLADSGSGPVLVEGSHQRRIHIFREDHKIRLIAADGINEKLHIFKKLTQTGGAAHLHLDQPQTHDTFRAEHCPWRGVINVIPFDQRGIGLGFGVIQQVICQGFLDVEVIAELESHHGIVDLLALHLVDIVAGR